MSSKAKQTQNKPVQINVNPNDATDKSDVSTRQFYENDRGFIQYHRHFHFYDGDNDDEPRYASVTDICKTHPESRQCGPDIWGIIKGRFCKNNPRDALCNLPPPSPACKAHPENRQCPLDIWAFIKGKCTKNMNADICQKISAGMYKY